MNHGDTQLMVVFNYTCTLSTVLAPDSGQVPTAKKQTVTGLVSFESFEVCTLRG